MTPLPDQTCAIIVMGVCGSGKSTLANGLSKHLNAQFVEGDALHPEINITKMSRGIPLDDDDRWPWLQRIRDHSRKALETTSVVIACSALKCSYRDELRRIANDVLFVHLSGEKSVVLERMNSRPDHFMPADLVDSQYEVLESTNGEGDVIELDFSLSLEDQIQIVERALDEKSVKLKESPHLALIGLGVMGGNLASNIYSNGYRLETCEINPGLRERFLSENPGKSCHESFSSLVENLKRPRCIFLLIKAGAPVDQVLLELLSLADPGDIIIDLGNSHYKDTQRRCDQAAAKRIRFVGCGISGGAEGARVGPALMPGGDANCYPLLKSFFADIAASYLDEPCVTWIGPGGAGHFVKMVHNGIEYADMQLIAECYQVMRDGLQLNTDEIASVFNEWNSGPLESYLIEATAQIFCAKEEDGAPLIDRILDKAGQKGTGGWSTEAALEFGVPATLITEAVMARIVSSQKTTREHYEKHFSKHKDPLGEKAEMSLKHLESALYCAKIINYAQGFMLMAEASNQNNWQLDFASIARIWRAGCIIRGRILNDIVAAYREGIQFSLFDSSTFSYALQSHHVAAREVIKFSLDHAIPTPALSSSIAFFDSIQTASSSANLIQAQRDFFGAHTFERTDQPEGEFFHADWSALTQSPKK